MTHFENIIVSLIKGTVITMAMRDEEVINGQYELTTEESEPRVCLYTDRKLEYEYFPLKEVESLYIERIR